MCANDLDPLGLAAGRVLFYPACGFDWNPLRRLTHLADTFVYCDWGISCSDFQARLCDFDGEGLTLDEAQPLDDDLRSLVNAAGAPPLTPEERDRYFTAIRDFQIDRNGWGYEVSLRRRFGRVERPIRLIYFGAEGVATYHALFNAAGISPQIVVFYQPGHGFGMNWTNFYDWSAPFARVVQKNRAGRPELLLLANYAHDQIRWPYEVTWQVLWPWGGFGAAIALAERELDLPVAGHLPPGDPRVVEVVRGRISQENWRGADAILLPGRVYRANRWLDGCQGLRIIVDTKHEAPPASADIIRVCGMFAVPALTALNRIEAVCEQHGIDHLATIPVGYEDEGESLLEWRRGEEKPSRLTLYTMYPGDVVAFAPYVDQIA